MIREGKAPASVSPTAPADPEFPTAAAPTQRRLRAFAGAARWFLPGAAIFTVARLPSFFEPHWYTDEAGYATTAHSMLHGAVLYSGVWNNKPPLHFWTLAVPIALFGPSEAGLHALTYISGLLTLAAVFFAARRMFGTWQAAVATAITGCLLGLPVFNAELALPESLLIAPTSWAGAILATRIHAGRETGVRWWPLGVGVLAAAAIAYQQTAVADAAAFWLVLAVVPWTRRRALALYSGAVAGITAVWVLGSMALAGVHRVAFALAGFYIRYTISAQTGTDRRPALHLALIGGALLLLVAGAALNRRRPQARWVLIVWSGATLLVTGAANQPFPHFLVPSIAPTILAISALIAGVRHPRWRAVPRAAPLAVGLGIACYLGSVGGLDWITPAGASVSNTYRSLGEYYVDIVRVVVDGGSESYSDWTQPFDGRVLGDAATADWIRGHGLAGSRAVVWASDAWLYLLDDLPVLLPTAPIYNDEVLLGQNGQVASRVAALRPVMIVAQTTDLKRFPEIQPVLDRGYRVVFASDPDAVYLRNDIPLPSG